MILARCVGNLGGFSFVDELDFKEIPVLVKRNKKEECPSGLILVNFNCEFIRTESSSSSESSSGEE